jgi:uncharacterized protein (DUF1330 family)
MLHLTQLVYVRPGQEEAFEAFEAVALPLVAKHGGELLLRLRPREAEVVAASIEVPYEIHLVRFPSEEHFARFAQDEERKSFLHLKEASVRASLLIKGSAA